MVSPEPVLTLDDARRIVADHGFKPAAPTTSRPRLGVEIEWHTTSIERPGHAVSFDRLEAAAHAVHLPGASRLTFEPGLLLTDGEAYLVDAAGEIEGWMPYREVFTMLAAGLSGCFSG